MKKKLIMIILSICAAVGVTAGLVACENNDKRKDTDSESESESESENTMDIDEVIYYGCPNSRRVRKLRLKRRTL